VSGHFLRRLSAGVAIAVCAADSAAAQGREPQRPFRPTYELAEEMPRRLLSLGAGLFEARGETLGTQQESGASDLEAGRLYSGAHGVATYLRRSRRVLFTGTASAGLRYYPSLDRSSLTEHGAVGTLDILLGRSRIRATEAVRRLPYQQLIFLASPIGDIGPQASEDQAFGTVPNTSYFTSVGFDRRIGRYGELTLDYASSLTRSEGSIGQHVQRAGGLFVQKVGRNLELRLGHHLRWGQIGRGVYASNLVSNDIDAGLVFTRGLSLARRTTVSFGSGSAIAAEEGRRKFVLTGSASLNHAMGRTWNFLASIDRGLETPEALARPVVSTRLTAGIGGYWGRRLSLRLRATAGVGDVGLEEPGRYTSYATEARASVDIARTWRWYVEHYYFQQDAEGAAAAAGIPSAVFRRGVRTGFELQWTMLHRRAR